MAGWALAVAATWPGAVQAEKADRSKPWIIEGDRDATLDEQRRTFVIVGNAVISQGSMALRAERIEVQEQGGVVRQAVAVGSAPRWATFRQKRDLPNEHIEALAERIEYDGANDTVRFVGQAELRIVRGAVTIHEVKGALLYWDNKRERFGAEGEKLKDGSATGRFKWTLSPASAPAAAPANAPPPAGERK